MAGPPNNTWMNMRLIFGGTAIPLGAVCTFGSARGPLTIEETFDAMEDVFGSLQSVISTEGCAITQLEIKVGPDSTGPTYTRAVNLVGSSSGAALTPNTALLIRKTIDFASARKAGRVFWPAVRADALINDGDLNPTFLESVQGLLDEGYDAFDAVGIDLALFPAVGSDPEFVSSLDVQGRLSTQRRRLRR